MTEIQQTDRIRLFIGVYPPLDVVRSWLATARSVAPDAARYTPAAQAHLTLLFLGETPRAAVYDLVEALARRCAPLAPIELVSAYVATLPRTRPRLLAAMCESTASLHAARTVVVQAAEDLGLGGDGRFTPHVTLCRFARGANVRSLQRAMDARSASVEAMRLMASELRPDGAAHACVAEVRLCGGAVD